MWRYEYRNFRKHRLLVITKYKLLRYFLFIFFVCHDLDYVLFVCKV